MSDNIPFCSVTGVTNVISASVVEAHNANTATATIEARSTTLKIGNLIVVRMGYSDGVSGVVFTGYVKQIEKNVPDRTVTIVANDILVRAIEYFIAPANPNDTIKRSNIQAEDLISELLGLCGLSLTSYSTTYFTLANTGELEVKLTSVFDYCNALANLLTWSLWADRSGNIYFKNRKPFPMYGTSGQPGDFADTYIAVGTITTTHALNFDYSTLDRDLRNRIVVYGSGTQAEASAESPYLPAGFYKTAVIGAEMMLDSYEACLDTANYNLALYNRLTRNVSMIVRGDYRYEARKCIKVNATAFTPVTLTTTDWYIYSCEHNYSSAGYICNLELRIQ